MGRGGREKLPNWTDSHPDRRLWTPEQAALASTMSQAAYEALYGRVSPGKASDEMMALAERGSSEFLFRYAEGSPGTASEVLQDPVFRTFISAAQRGGDIYGRMPDSQEWQNHFRLEAARIVAEEGGGSIGQIVWEWNADDGEKYFLSRSQSFLDILETDPARYEEARQWIDEEVLPAIRSNLPRAEEFTRSAHDNALPNELLLLDVVSERLRASGGERPNFQSKRDSYIIEKSLVPSDPLREGWHEGPGDYNHLPWATRNYQWSDLGRVSEAQAEMTAATLAVVARGDTEIEPLRNLHDATKMALENGNAEEMLCRLEGIFLSEGEGNLFEEMKEIARRSGVSSVDLADIFLRASRRWNRGWSKEGSLPETPLSVCIADAIRESASR